MNGQQGARRGSKIISKSQRLVVEDSTLSPMRAAGAGLGGTAVVYGVPRLRLTQSALGVGLNSPSRNARTLASAANRARIAMEVATEPVGHLSARIMQRSPEGRYLLARLPRGVRIGAATLGGGALLARSVPTTKVRRRPVAG